MAKRHTSRQAARRRLGRAHQAAHQSRYRRKLRYEPLEHRRLLALVTVDTLDDTVDLNDGRTSLREAIFATNLVGGPDAIEFAPALTANGRSTILLVQGELKITDGLMINGPGADLLTIDASGNDPTPELNDGKGSRVLNIDDGVAEFIDVSIVDLTLTGGDVANSGGAIFSAENLSILESTISGNFATSFLSSGGGGGVFARNGRVAIHRSIFESNSATRPGGAFTTENAIVTIEGSEIAGNASQDGGAVRVQGGSASLSRSIVTGNSVANPFSLPRSAGIDVTNASLVISDTTISGNIGGSGLHVSTGSGIAITNSTFSDNEAYGLSISQQAGDATLTQNVIKGNDRSGIYARARGGSVTISESVIHGNGRSDLNRTGGGIGASLTDGSSIVIRDVDVANNHAVAIGGGIYIDVRTGCSATIRDSRIHDNDTEPDPGSSTDSTGGGIAIFSSGNALVTNCTVFRNRSDRFAGGINLGGTGTIERTTVTDNTTGGAGGGIRIGGSGDSIGASVVDCEVRDNIADRGGGIYVSQPSQVPHTILRTHVSGNTAVGNEGFNQIYSGQGGGMFLRARADVVGSVIEKNTAKRSGGGIYTNVPENVIDCSAVVANSAESGGGLFSRHALIRQSTISGNTAVVGGGLFSRVRTTVEHSTVASNTGTAGGVGRGIFVYDGRLLLNHSIVANNSGYGDINALTGVTIASRFSLIGDSFGSGLTPAPVGSPDANGNLVGTALFPGTIDPLLGPLVINGGPTPSHALLQGSPALNAGDPTAIGGVAGVPQFDQRGEPFTRVTGRRIDIGAFESQPNLLIGDYNFDDVVDAADYAIWHNTRNSTSDLRADGNADGIVDEMDRLVWRSNFGQTVAISEATQAGDALMFDEVSAATFGKAVADYVGSPGVAAGMADDSPVIVNTLLDVVDFNDGITSLREAIFATNLVSGPDTIEFSPDLTAGGPATILLTQGELRITDNLTINGPGSSRLTIDASGNDLTPDIDDGKGSRVFHIDDGLATSIEVTFKGLSFTGGDVSGVGGGILSLESLVIESCTVVENTVRPSTAVSGGGGIAASLRDGAHFEMTNSVVSNNRAAGDGGGIFLSVGTNCTVQIDDSRISGNHVPLMTRVTIGGGIAIRNNRGSVTITDSEILDNSTPGNGGGIAFDGSVTIERSSISGNSSLSSGGGIFHGLLSGQFGALTLVDSEVANNTAVNGGGIRLSQSASTPHTIERSKILDNTATDKMPSSSVGGNGGGILTSQGALRIVESTIDGNHARTGGGVFASFSNTSAAEFSIENSTVTNNTATQSGGGLYLSRGGIVRQSTISNNSASVGAGIYTAFDTKVVQSTVVENFADGEGAGIYLSNGSLLVDHSILAKNTAMLTSGDIVVAPNSIVTARHSLIGDNGTSVLTEAPVGSPDINGNLIGGAVHGMIDPLLGPLADYGGSTKTHALLPGSPAINAGNLNAKPGMDGVPLFDQRGEPFDRVVERPDRHRCV